MSSQALPLPLPRPSWTDHLPAWLSRPIKETELQKPAVVFSPHAGDELLGCGGTILRKRELGATVSIVFMTDGSGANRGAMPRHLHVERRAAEAAASARLLGCSEADLHFLEIEEGFLTDDEQQAGRQVLDILDRLRPPQLFIPSALDRQEDSVATWRIVTAALKRWKEPCTVYEYPVWLWSAPCALLRVLTDFTLSVPITHYLQRKQAALECHESRMTRMGRTGSTLADVEPDGLLRRLASSDP